MKNFKHFGIKRRILLDHNYDAVWLGNNLKTIRFGEGHAQDLPYDNKEFYDLGLGTLCRSGRCNFCYVSANSNGEWWKSPKETWKKWMATKHEEHGIIKADDEVLWDYLPKEVATKVKSGELKPNVTYTDKPFQIAIGSTCEPTEHPEFCSFLEGVYETNVVPNYTTNGVILSFAHNVKDWKTKRYSEAEVNDYIAKSHQILEYTKKYVGGVAVSYGNKLLRPFAQDAVKALLMFGDTNINIHHIIGCNKDVDEFVELAKEYGDDIKYHVLLPLMPEGRSTKGMDEGTFEYLEENILKNNIDNVAFGANFSPYLEGAKIKTWNYPPESLSANILLKENLVEITPSSFNLNSVMKIEV